MDSAFRAVVDNLLATVPQPVTQTQSVLKVLAVILVANRRPIVAWLHVAPQAMTATCRQTEPALIVWATVVRSALTQHPSAIPRITRFVLMGSGDVAEGVEVARLL
jgi:hypothetical protein